jgi:hypothetical protein
MLKANCTEVCFSKGIGKDTCQYRTGLNVSRVAYAGLTGKREAF